MNFASLNAEESETVINRVRADGNTVYVYSSDMRVIRRVLKAVPEIIEKTHINKNNEITAIRLKLSVKEFKKSLFFPTYRGSNAELEGDKEGNDGIL